MWRFVILIVGVHCLTGTLAAPPGEPCPPDSALLDNGECACDLDACVKPPCEWELKLVSNGTGVVGSCCPIYECFGCENETKIDGKCPCAKGAVIDEKGYCTCTQKDEHLINGECVCNPTYCSLPPLCDKKSVLVSNGTNTGKCCEEFTCKPCPDDSESTTFDEVGLEDHCVCLPCRTECGPNKTAVIKRKGTLFPGSCCDIYECEPTIPISITVKSCTDGDEWITEDTQQICRCQNGVSLCSDIEDGERSQLCIERNKAYRLNETWTTDDGCTNCTCVMGRAKCISHYCDVNESQISANEQNGCVKESKSYANLEQWFEEEDCSNCICDNGKIKCNQSECENKKKDECRPLFDCHKTCPQGFKLNKKGCEICKCSTPNKVVTSDLLTKYNITLSELISILDDYKNSKSTETSTSIVDTNSVEVVQEKLQLKEGNATSTTEPAVKRANQPDHKCPISESALSVILIVLAALVLVFVTCGVLFCCYKNKRKQSLDLASCKYENVKNNNNIRITKTAQPLMEKP